MAGLPDIDELTQGLDGQARAVVVLLHGMVSVVVEKLEAMNEKLQAENAELKRMLFGQKSERRVMPSMSSQTVKRSKAKETAEEKARREQAAKEKRAATRKARQALPTVEEHSAVPEGDKVCPCCAGEFRPLGDGLCTDQYEYVAARLIKKRRKRQKLVCRCGETIVTAPPPPQVTEGAEYGPGLHAHVVVSKCADSMPLYRQAKQLARAGVPVSRSTLTDLFHRSADLLSPLHSRMLDLVADSTHVNADETPLKVLAPGKCRRAYVWTFISDNIIAYTFSPTRAGETPKRVLGETKGVLQVDGYSGYNRVTTPSGRVRVSCWAHVRRYFFNALPTSPEAEEVMDLIADLYAIEYLARERGIQGSDAHRLLRDTESRQIVTSIEKWLEEHKSQARPTSPLGRAIKYATGQMKALKIFLDDPNICLDNNKSEAALRIIAVGRKNFLFAGSDSGGENLAILQSLVSTCEANGVNPQDYLSDVLIRIQTHPHSRIDELLPQNWQPPNDGTIDRQS